MQKLSLKSGGHGWVQFWTCMGVISVKYNYGIRNSNLGGIYVLHIHLCTYRY